MKKKPFVTKEQLEEIVKKYWMTLIPPTDHKPNAVSSLR